MGAGTMLLTGKIVCRIHAVHKQTVAVDDEKKEKKTLEKRTLEKDVRERIAAREVCCED